VRCGHGSEVHDVGARILSLIRSGLSLTQTVEATMLFHDNFNRKQYYDVYNHWLKTDEVLDLEKKAHPYKHHKDRTDEERDRRLL
jgi:hypothetical protein